MHSMMKRVRGGGTESEKGREKVHRDTRRRRRRRRGGKRGRRRRRVTSGENVLWSPGPSRLMLHHHLLLNLFHSRPTVDGVRCPKA